MFEVILDCKARRISEIRCSDGWVYGVVLESPALKDIVLTGTEEAARYLEGITKSSALFDLPDKSVVEFFNLTTDESAACDFLTKYGVFRKEDLRPRDFPKQVRAFWSNAAKKKRIPFALPLAEFWKEQADLKTLIRISGLVSKREKELLKNADRVVREYLGIEKLVAKLPVGIPLGVIPKLMFLNNLKADIGVEFRGGVVVPLIFTIHALPGLYAHVWERFAVRQPWAECQKCGKLFVATRSDKVHCSIGCKNAAKQQRYRESLKAKTSTKGRKR